MEQLLLAECIYKLTHSKCIQLGTRRLELYKDRHSLHHSRFALVDIQWLVVDSWVHIYIDRGPSWFQFDKGQKVESSIA